MKGKYDLFIFAGEASGDLHGQALLKALYAKNDHLKVFGVGGQKMRSEGMDCILETEKFQVMGFIDVFLAMPRLILQFYRVAGSILEHNPKVALFIDYPGFNLRMEKHLRKKGFRGKLFHYISPTVWVHGKGRIKTMEKNLDMLFTILPFEKKCFADSKLRVEYVGHPLTSRIQETVYEELPLPQNKMVLGLFPGSRKKEILQNFPLYAALIRKLKNSGRDLVYYISVSQDSFRPLLKKNLLNEGLHEGEEILFIDSSKNYSLMKNCHLAVAKSGTVTLELALHSVPTVVTYGAKKLDLFIAQKILGIDLPYYSLASLLCEQKVFPELIGPYFTLENLEKETVSFLDDAKKREHCKKLCFRLKDILQEKRASEEASKFILAALKNS